MLPRLVLRGKRGGFCPLVYTSGLIQKTIQILVRVSQASRRTELNHTLEWFRIHTELTNAMNSLIQLRLYHGMKGAHYLYGRLGFSPRRSTDQVKLPWSVHTIRPLPEHCLTGDVLEVPTTVAVGREGVASFLSVEAKSSHGESLTTARAKIDLWLLVGFLGQP